MGNICATIASWLGIAWIWFLSIFMHWGWIPNNLVAGPAVFVGENEYQIIWETRQPSSAWVTVGGRVFSDSLAGNLVLDQKAHKVRVPMEALDAAGGYEINWQQIMSSDTGSRYVKKGNHKAEKFDFRPIDFSDGLQIYNLSDTHSRLQPGAETAKYWGGKLDLLILNGDIINDIWYPADRNFALQLAFEITGGTRPVLYTRGNHETRGVQANGLERYLGGPGGDRWYFTTRLGPLWIAVFDAGEDKDDGHEEYHGLAYFEEYRERETRYFERAIANAAAEFGAPGVEYRLLVSHIPVGRIGVNPEIQARWVELANQMHPDLALSGHNHAVTYYPTGSYGALDYPLLIGSRPAHASEDGVFLAAAVEFKDGGIKGWFTDQSHAVTREIVVR